MGGIVQQGHLVDWRAVVFVQWELWFFFGFSFGVGLCIVGKQVQSPLFNRLLMPTTSIHRISRCLFSYPMRTTRSYSNQGTQAKPLLSIMEGKKTLSCNNIILLTSYVLVANGQTFNVLFEMGLFITTEVTQSMSTTFILPATMGYMYVSNQLRP